MDLYALIHCKSRMGNVQTTDEEEDEQEEEPKYAAISSLQSYEIEQQQAVTLLSSVVSLVSPVASYEMRPLCCSNCGLRLCKTCLNGPPREIRTVTRLELRNRFLHPMRADISVDVITRWKRARSYIPDFKYNSATSGTFRKAPAHFYLCACQFFVSLNCCGWTSFFAVPLNLIHKRKLSEQYEACYASIWILLFRSLQLTMVFRRSRLIFELAQIVFCLLLGTHI